jgi:hypothetical protein
MKTALIKLQLAWFIVATALLPTHAVFGKDKYLGSLGGLVNARGIDIHYIKYFINYNSTLRSYLCLSANAAALCLMNIESGNSVGLDLLKANKQITEVYGQCWVVPMEIDGSIVKCEFPGNDKVVFWVPAFEIAVVKVDIPWR